MFDLKEHLRTLVEAHAPSGHEEPVRNILREAWQDLTDEMQQDGLGSLIGIKRGTKPLETPRRIMLAAHIDEIGMMVNDIIDGFICVHRISGVDNRVMMAQPVIVHGKRPLPGIVATVPPHLLSRQSRGKYPSFNDFVIDVGLPADEVNDLVRVGDLITPDVTMLELQDGHFAAKAMDDRACVAAVTVALNMLQGMHHRWDVYATATVQEETGLYGARTAAAHIAPDIAIALDVGFAPQPGVNSDTIALDDGPAIAMGANFHPKLFDRIKETAKKHEIKLQEEVVPAYSGTDAWAIQVAQESIPTALLSIPLRNMHSPVETVKLKDIDRAGRLLAHFIADLDADFLAAINWDDLKANVDNNNSDEKVSESA
ncbi:MAG: M42 family peptidase [Chloroflexi bacterium]|nr:MAG: aminopeptidase [Phototrophicales bacterium]RMF76179.1 MAG: M42 family peptidase [Chloroflexota bacterium]